MLIHYDMPKINSVLNDFYSATGTRIDLFSDRFVPISYSQHEICSYCRQVQQDAGCKNACVAFDKQLLQKSKDSRKTQQQICPFGLLNIVTPILHEDMVIGYLFFGQMKTAPQFPETLPADLQADYQALPLFTISQSQSISRLAEILLRHILTENMLTPDASEMLPKAISYIQNNLDKDLSIKQISKDIHVSKSALYKRFRNRFHCTIGEYINKKRIEQSVVLLTTTALSMDEISQRCGFSNASYFTKTFKHFMGTTPLKFRKSQLL